MELAILILEDALNQQKEQLSQAIKHSSKAKNEKQSLMYSKAKSNLAGFIAELEKAIKILNGETVKVQSVCINKPTCSYYCRFKKCPIDCHLFIDKQTE